MGIELSKVDAIIAKHGSESRALIPLLLDVQREFFYLPEEALERVADKTGLPAIQVYQVARFYKAFSLKPRGKHMLTVCLGTACHVRGGDRLVDQVGRVLNIKPGQTSKDKQFTLETVMCLGCCALGPVMVVDGTYYGKMAANKVERIIRKYSGDGRTQPEPATEAC
ncbi:MAG TPA: NAD(P)H-dependent oxidoreductase subunit E [Anaerolineae bacterium]